MAICPQPNLIPASPRPSSPPYHHIRKRPLHHTDQTTPPPPTPNLVSLPTELLHQILQHLLPTNQTYPLRSLIPPTHPSKTPRILHRHESVHWGHYDWTLKLRRSSHDPIPPIIHALLLTHPILYTLVLQHVHATNTLHFPDAFTLTRFTAVCSPLALSCIKRLSIDACGMGVCEADGMQWHTVYEQPADEGIVEAIKALKGLRDLRLGGLGPGVWRRLRSGEMPGIVGWREDRTVWKVGDVRLLMGITGVGMGRDGCEVGGGVGPLEGGRVFHCRVPEKQLLAKSRGVLKVIGVRIVGKDVDDVVLGPREVELVDVRESLRRMEMEAEEVEIVVDAYLAGGWKRLLEDTSMES